MDKISAFESLLPIALLVLHFTVASSPTISLAARRRAVRCVPSSSRTSADARDHAIETSAERCLVGSMQPPVSSPSRVLSLATESDHALEPRLASSHRYLRSR